ncbi:TadE family protein [Sphaerobacter sp.]|uniref:TadE/TadG family type IV pilus assembly protein n=1 Tax=Sphaerobacter sp. TaxID=2099654 RepID=UPI001DEF1A9B|nr:TadE family protein [Sphaerobacter sp.]MBX5444720.1 pilus assembly protein [Sphaerobacter sp.]
MQRQRRRQHSAGQGMVEFAISSLLFFTLIFGVIEMGWLLFTYHQVTSAAREGTRYASVHGTMSQGLRNPAEIAAYTIDPAAVKTAVLKKVTLSDPDALSVTVVRPDGDLQPRHRVRVEVSYPYRPLVGFILPVPTLTLRASSTMIVHY